MFGIRLVEPFPWHVYATALGSLVYLVLVSACRRSLIARILWSAIGIWLFVESVGLWGTPRLSGPDYSPSRRPFESWQWSIIGCFGAAMGLFQIWVGHRVQIADCRIADFRRDDIWAIPKLLWAAWRLRWIERSNARGARSASRSRVSRLRSRRRKCR